MARSLLRFLWKKVRQLEKSAPAVLVALVTNHSYASHQTWRRAPRQPLNLGAKNIFSIM